MKILLNKQARTIILTLAVFVLPTIASAQFGPLPDSGSPDGPESTDVPFDGGLSILIAGAAGYGIKKYRNYKTQNEN